MSSYFIVIYNYLNTYIKAIKSYSHYYRSEIKNGKLTLTELPTMNTNSGGILQGSIGGASTNLPPASLTGRSWTPEMLTELAPSRQRAIQRKKQILLTHLKSPMLGDLWLDEFK